MCVLVARSSIYLSLQLDWGLVWLPRSPASRGGGRGTSVACGSWGGSLRYLFQGQLHPYSLSLFLLPHLSGIQACGVLLRSCSFRVFGLVWPQFLRFEFRLATTDAQLSITIPLSHKSSHNCNNCTITSGFCH